MQLVYGRVRLYRPPTIGVWPRTYTFLLDSGDTITKEVDKVYFGRTYQFCAFSLLRATLSGPMWHDVLDLSPEDVYACIDARQLDPQFILTAGDEQFAALAFICTNRVETIVLRLATERRIFLALNPAICYRRSSDDSRR